MQLLSGELEEDGARLRSLDIRFDLAYDGNFRIDVDAVMLLGKIANISITGDYNLLTNFINAEVSMDRCLSAFVP